MSEPIRLLIHGASGRMGQALLRLCGEQAGCQVVAAVTNKSPAQRVVEGVPFFAAKELSGVPAFDVAVDFSLPEGFDPILALCVARGAALVSGTTGLSETQRADLDAAASAFVAAGFGSASQRCMAVSLLLPVGQATADRLRELVIEKTKALKVGPYNDPQADFGAVVSAQSKQAVLQAIENCIKDGGELLLDGRGLQVPGHANGYYVGPTLFDRVTTDMQMYKEEIFGPVRAIMRPMTLDEAIAITNAHDFGNGSVIYTRDGKSAHRFMTEVESGMIGVNVSVPLPAAYFNFGGLRRSKFGEGHLYGPDAARFYTKIKTISQRWPDADQQASPVSLAFNPKA